MRWNRCYLIKANTNSAAVRPSIPVSRMKAYTDTHTFWLLPKPQALQLLSLNFMPPPIPGNGTGDGHSAALSLSFSLVRFAEFMYSLPRSPWWLWNRSTLEKREGESSEAERPKRNQDFEPRNRESLPEHLVSFQKHWGACMCVRECLMADYISVVLVSGAARFISM